MNWQEKFKSVLLEKKNKNEEYCNYYTEIIDPSFADIKVFLNESFPELIIEVAPYQNNGVPSGKNYSEISIKLNTFYSFNYKIKIKETYKGKKLLVKYSKINEAENTTYSEKDLDEEILLTKTYKEGPTIEVIEKEDIINDLINKFNKYQSLLYTTGFLI